MAEGISVICGDAADEMKKLPGKSINLIVTDPPYNLGKNYDATNDRMNFDDYMTFSSSWLNEAKRVLKDDGSIYIILHERQGQFHLQP